MPITARNSTPALVIKVNSNQRYATNSETAGFFRHLCMAEEVPVQSFVVRSDMGCGSTIGPITASHLGVRTVDIGLPTFAMHSIRELCGSHDLAHLVKVLSAFYACREAAVSSSPAHALQAAICDLVGAKARSDRSLRQRLHRSPVSKSRPRLQPLLSTRQSP